MSKIDLNEIPVIDVNHLQENSSNYKQAIKNIKSYCHDPGFFCLENLPIEMKKNLDHTHKHMENFFSYDDNHRIKQDINVTGKNNSYGWMPIFQEPAYEAGTTAHVESFDFGRPEKVPESKNYNKNYWPALDSFKRDIRSTWDNYTDLGMLTLKAISKSLELPTNFLSDRCNTQDLSTMRLLNYPATDKKLITKEHVGISAHTDFECITLISQTAPGLELKSRNNSWYEASSDNKKVVVIIGKMLEIWTNGHIKATKHRVNNREWQRYSTVLFFGVNDQITIKPLTQFLRNNGLSDYGAITQREHINNEISKAEKNRDKDTNIKVN
jgi:isopenicillin N synthase-like dioxygenase|tara:strand:+ start:12860 stop:13837 length:978 start_codon:yes stop_codon:yes gene_type:complete